MWGGRSPGSATKKNLFSIQDGIETGCQLALTLFILFVSLSYDYLLKAFLFFYSFGRAATPYNDTLIQEKKGGTGGY